MFKAIRKRFEVGRVLALIAATALMVFLNNVGDGRTPFSSALYFCMLVCGQGVFASSACFLFALLPTFDLSVFFACLVQSAVLCVIYGTFGKKYKLGLPSFVFLPASLSPYILLGDERERIARLIAVAVITVFAVGFYPFAAAFSSKGFRRATPVETASLACLYVCAFMGGIKYLGEDVYKAVAIVLLGVLSLLLSGRESCLVAFVLALPAVVYARSALTFAPFLLMGGTSFIFARCGRVVYLAALLMAELTSAYLFGWYGEYEWINLIYPVVGVLVIAPFPERVLRAWSSTLSLGSQKPLARSEINRTRNAISSRLCEISGTFREISALFAAAGEAEDPFVYEEAIMGEVMDICKGCPFSEKCREAGVPGRDELLRLIAIAKGKGRLTAVDLPKRLSDKCSQTGKIVFAVNKYVARYSAEIERKKAAMETREIVAVQADGIAFALKSIAVELCKNLSFDPKKEQKVCAFLIKKGINVQEVMIYGEGDEVEIQVVTYGREEAERLTKAVNECLKAKFCTSDRYSVGDGREIFVLERACRADCVFGVATAVKEGESRCGDTHSMLRLGRNKFMLALSDGMGSGELAGKTSGTSLALIESMYRAGVGSEVALNTVNRLLSFTGEDNFAALDLSVIDLESMTCDFIKLGAPYGFIVSASAVRLIEGSSLPMGILGEARPAVCTEAIRDGDVILFMSDGITDAFGSATDMSDFLNAVSASNPQKLADKILEEALALSACDGHDDMTVVACKIFAA